MSLNIVGWLDDFEWYLVYKNLFDSSQKQKLSALNRIKIWRARVTSNIPVAIEATARLIECQLVIESLASEDAQQQMLGGAVSHFVGLITEKGLKGMGFGFRKPIRVIGEEMGIPQWVVNLRHETVHGLLPSRNMLKKALEFSIEWIKMYYWDEQAVHLSHFVEDAQEISNDNDTNIISVLKEYALVSWKESYPEFFEIDKVSKSTRMDVFKKLKSLTDVDKELAKSLPDILLSYGIIRYESNCHVVKVNKTNNCLPNFIPQFQRCWRLLLYYINGHEELPRFMHNIIEEIEYYTAQKTEKCKAKWYTAWLDLIFTTMNKELCAFSVQDWSKLFKQVCCYQDLLYKDLILRHMLLCLKQSCSRSQFTAMVELTNIDIETEDDHMFVPESNPVSRATSFSDLNSIGPWKLCDTSFKACPLGLIPGQDTRSLNDCLSVDKLTLNLNTNMLENDIDDILNDNNNFDNAAQKNSFDKTEKEWADLAQSVELF